MFNFERTAACFADASPCIAGDDFTRNAVAWAHSPVAGCSPRPIPMAKRQEQTEGRSLSRRDSLDFELLHLIETEPGLSQREIADRLGISLGRTNYCLKALIEKGALKLANFRASKNKLGYVYVLTPRGIAQRAALAGSFLQRKLAEYERLKAQIDTLQNTLAGKEAP